MESLWQNSRTSRDRDIKASDLYVPCRSMQATDVVLSDKSRTHCPRRRGAKCSKDSLIAINSSQLMDITRKDGRPDPRN